MARKRLVNAGVNPPAALILPFAGIDGAEWALRRFSSPPCSTMSSKQGSFRSPA
jgi:hypothetical protein